mmetsp:Transcript_37531/g.75055  ORF Transcript_37531/g.75055 Transcript_37531/m.75055 type:complete len:220 (+) Transcript_37531:891-1550(+)
MGLSHGTITSITSRSTTTLRCQLRYSHRRYCWFAPLCLRLPAGWTRQQAACCHRGGCCSFSVAFTCGSASSHASHTRRSASCSPSTPCCPSPPPCPSALSRAPSALCCGCARPLGTYSSWRSWLFAPPSPPCGPPAKSPTTRHLSRYTQSWVRRWRAARCPPPHACVWATSGIASRRPSSCRVARRSRSSRTALKDSYPPTSARRGLKAAARPTLISMG